MTIRKGTKIIAGNNSASTLYPDNKTIKKDSFNKIAVNAVKDQNIGVTKFWSGTLAEYTSIEHDSDTIYHITDDTCEEQTSSILNEEILQQLSQKLDNTQLYNKITNCLLEVPQRIKLEINDGIVTLKAGSVVILPYGVTDKTNEFPVGTRFLNDNFKVYDTQFADDKFFVWTELQSDIIGTANTSMGNGLYVFGVKPETNNFSGRLANTQQGSGDGSNLKSNDMYYHTVHNAITQYLNGVNEDINCSFPIFFINKDDTGLTSIDQIFNGFGYIGSTVWIDKDVKALVPNGRNEDYSLNNIIHTTPKLLVRQFPTNANGDYYIGIDLSNDDYIVPQDIIVLDRKAVMYEQDTRPNVTIAKWFDTVNNQYYFWNEKDPRPEINDLYKLKDLFVATCYVKDAVITSYSPKQPIKALNEQDKPIISGWSMPSSKYVDLTLGASGSTYTAPANGYFYMRGKSSAANQQIYMCNTNTILETLNKNPLSSSYCFCHIPARRGDIVQVSYTVTADLSFKFIYAEGEI